MVRAQLLILKIVAFERDCRQLEKELCNMRSTIRCDPRRIQHARTRKRNVSNEVRANEEKDDIIVHLVVWRVHKSWRAARAVRRSIARGRRVGRSKRAE